MIYQSRDSEQRIISNAIGAIPKVRTFSTTSGIWIPIITDIDTLNIILQPRDVITWFFATSSGNADYFTVRNGGAIQTRLVSVSGTIIGWVTSNQTEIFEMMQGS